MVLLQLCGAPTKGWAKQPKKRPHLPWFRKRRCCSGFSVCLRLCVLLVQIGQFFGEVDPVLMINLVNTSLYSYNKTYDYQSVCDPEKDSKAAAGPRSVYVVRICSMIDSSPDLKKKKTPKSSINFLSFFSLPLQTC